MLFLEIHFNVNTNSLGTVFSDLDIYRLLTFQVPNHVQFPLLTAFLRICWSLRPCAVFRSMLSFYGGDS